MSLAVFWYGYTQNHLDAYFAVKAENALKKNDLENAQKYYEKAFDLGMKESKHREAYVNTIINSPLTIESQEKLLKFINDSVDEDYAKYKAKCFFYDIKREIHKKYPENYIKHAVYNQKIMRWGSSLITYAFENKNTLPDYFVNEIEKAFSKWEDAVANEITFKESSINPNIIIRLEESTPIAENAKKYVVAYTLPITENQKLKQMEIAFYKKDAEGQDFSKIQIYNTALHEIVHAIGFMGHCNDKENIMYLSKDSMSLVDDTREELTEADINTIKLLYKIKPEITNINDNRSVYIPYLVLGDEKEVLNLKIEEAKNYIRKAPNLPAGYVDLAEGYVAEKDFESAIKNLKKALKLAGSDEIKEIIFYNLSVSYLYLGDLAEAQKYLDFSMQIQDSEEKYYLLAEIYTRKGDFEKAIKEYLRLIEKNPSNIEYIIALVNIYIVKKEYINARNVLKNYFNKYPQEKNNPRLSTYGVLKLGL